MNIYIKQTKICKKCNTEKSVNDYHKDKSRKDGIYSWCKSCALKDKAKYYNKNRIDRIEKQKQWNLKNPEYNHNRYINNLDYFSQHNKNWYKEHQEEVKSSRKQICSTLEYKINRNQKRRERRKKDINYRLLENCRTCMHHALKNNQKTGHTIELLMCSIEELKIYLESKFQLGMTWKNYGYGRDKWNIDHIIPCGFFNMLSQAEQYMCFRWQNLQPMWQLENFSKGDKILV